MNYKTRRLILAIVTISETLSSPIAYAVDFVRVA